jgi:DNA-binding HxlR family transcriptional regulator
VRSLLIGTADIRRLGSAEGGTFLSPDHLTPPSEECLAIRGILNRIGDKWSLQVIAVLSDGPRRFNELRRRVDGISQRMLTLTLRLLQRDGLIVRTVFATVPPSVEYDLTPLGRTLAEPVRALSQWTLQHRHEIREAQARFDAAPSSCGLNAESATSAEDSALLSPPQWTLPRRAGQ